jgi:peroxiredoxin (alkyl hydroperoxide reductase subunit C)
LQTSDKHGVATPANWRPGDKVIVPPANNQELAEQRVADKNVECKDWYFCLKEIK